MSTSRAARIAQAIAAYCVDAGELTPGTIETWGPADTADLPVTEPDGSTWTVRVFKGLNDKDAEAAARIEAMPDPGKARRPA